MLSVTCPPDPRKRGPVGTLAQRNICFADAVPFESVTAARFQRTAKTAFLDVQSDFNGSIRELCLFTAKSAQKPHNTHKQRLCYT